MIQSNSCIIFIKTCNLLDKAKQKNYFTKTTTININNNNKIDLNK